MENKRNSRIELLKIMSMFLIIAFHANRTYGVYMFYQSPFTKFVNKAISSWGILGVDIFVIISSWYLSDKRFSFKRFCNIAFEAISYFLLMSTISALVYSQSISYFLSELVKNSFSFLSSPCYWFILAYLLMYLLTPLLNKICKCKNFGKIIILLSFIPFYSNFIYDCNIPCDVMNFCYIYLVTQYLKENISKLKISNFWLFLFMCVLIGLLMSIRVYHSSIGKRFIRKVMDAVLVNTGRHSLIMLLISYLIFIINIRKKPFTNKIINWISSFTLGVYCFHENPVFNIVNCTYDIFYSKGIITNENYFYMNILVILLIICCGILFEFIRRNTLQKGFNSLISKSKYLPKIDSWINNI